MSMIKLALIGLGVMGSNHYRVAKTIIDFKVMAVCDFTHKDEFKVPHFKSVDELLNSGIEFDAAIVATPTFTHLEIAKKLILANKILLVEKPVASSVQEGQELSELAKLKEVGIVIGYIERFNPVIATLKKELQNKKIHNINITRVGPFPPHIGDVGILVDLAVHDVDLMRFLTDKEILKTQIFKAKKIHNHYEDNAVLNFMLEDESIGTITTNWLTPFKRRQIFIACEEAFFEADLMSQELVEYSKFKKNNSCIMRNCLIFKGEPLRLELEAFANFVKTGNKGIFATIEDSMTTLKIVNA